MSELDKSKDVVSGLSPLITPLNQEKKKSVEDFMKGFTKALELVAKDDEPIEKDSKLKTG